MKFKKDGTGWRDLKVAGKDAGMELNFSIPEKGKKVYAGPFVSANDDTGSYACVYLSRRKMRAIAEAILRELDRG